MGSRHPVTVSRSTAEAIVALASHGAPPMGHALDELRAAMSDAAEAAAWEPFRRWVLDLTAAEAASQPYGVAHLDQVVAQMRTQFERAAMSIDDPVVVRSILVTAGIFKSCAQQDRADGTVTADEAGVVIGTATVIAIAAARLVDPEALR